VFVAELNGELVGYADVQGNGYIDHFFVSGKRPQPKRSKRSAPRATRGGYRVRQGDYRVVYLIDDKAMTVTIYEVGHRKHTF
jgi:mRNA-degrading endonuclease RelE of RelBE toxin-antitoxin system